MKSPQAQEPRPDTADSVPIEIGLDTFGDITRSSDGGRLSASQVLRDVTKMVLFIVSDDASSYSTGAEFVVYRGWSGCSISACIPPAMADDVVSWPAVAMITSQHRLEVGHLRCELLTLQVGVLAPEQLLGTDGHRCLLQVAGRS